MLRADLFPNFKGADTLLLWGDAQGIAELHKAVAALSRRDASTVTVGGLVISAAMAQESPSTVSRNRFGLVWVCSAAVLVEAERLIASLDEVPAGHQFIEIAGIATQVLVSKNEYPEVFRPVP